jgi:hypothetical protein
MRARVEEVRREPVAVDEQVTQLPVEVRDLVDDGLQAGRVSGEAIRSSLTTASGVTNSPSASNRCALQVSM